MTQLKVVAFGIIIVLMSIAIYLAWQNRASEKIIAGFLSVALIGSVGTLASTLFTIKDEVRNMTLTKSYVFHIINKELLTDFTKPYFNWISGLDHDLDIQFLLKEAIGNDPKSQILLDDKGNSKTIEEGLNIYDKVFMSEIILTLFNNCKWMAKVRRSKGYDMLTISYGETPKVYII